MTLFLQNFGAVKFAPLPLVSGLTTMCQKSTAHEQRAVVLVESQESCALVRIVRLQKFDRKDNMIFTVHLNRLIEENTPLEQSSIETCQQEAYKYQKVTKISCDIGSRFEAS